MTVKYLTYAIPSNSIERILKPGGIAVRSYSRNSFFSDLVEKNKLDLLDSNTSLPHKHGDVVTVFSKPL